MIVHSAHPDRITIAEKTIVKYGKRKTWQQRIRGGSKRVPADFKTRALTSGVEVELEHTDDPLIALEIAMDHLDEDNNYYTKLEKVHGEINPRGEMSRSVYLRSVADRLARGG